MLRRPSEAGDAHTHASAALGAGPVPSGPSPPWAEPPASLGLKGAVSSGSPTQDLPAPESLRPWSSLPVGQGWPAVPVSWVAIKEGRLPSLSGEQMFHRVARHQGCTRVCHVRSQTSGERLMY